MVTRTGWLLEYIDKMCLRRAIELLEYWRREAVWQAEAMKKQGTGTSYVEPNANWEPPDEGTVEAQFGAMPRAGAQQVGVAQDVTRMPEHLRDMVRWAEDFKANKLKVN